MILRLFRRKPRSIERELTMPEDVPDHEGTDPSTEPTRFFLDNGNGDEDHPGEDRLNKT